MGDLEWPPKGDDLRRLYLEEKLSAAKIANAYGLKYPNPKSGETLVLYHLEKFGIARRDRAEHVRKVTPRMVSEWINRYEAGESLKQIAGTVVKAETVWDHLRKRGVRMRNKVDAQITAVTKHPKKPFVGSQPDQAYLIGFARGDLNVSSNGRAVRIKTATTHPLMVDLIKSLFADHGLVRITPRHSGLAGYEWSVQVDVDQSFSFLLKHRKRIPSWAFGNRSFWSFVAGFFDAEGSIRYNEKAGYGFSVSITNSDEILLDRIHKVLLRQKFHSYKRYDSRSRVWRVELWRKGDVERFLKFIPLRHPEKMAKAHLALRYGGCNSDAEFAAAITDWRTELEEIMAGRDAFVAKAREEIVNDS